MLLLMDSQVRTPVGASGVGRGSFPVVEVAGLGSDGSGFGALTARLQGEGVTVLDLDPAKTGTQPLVYRPDDDEDIAELAVRLVAPAIDAALARAGLAPDQEVDVVAHSTGGLLVRYLIEHPVPTSGASWAERIDDLVMVAVPNHGSDVIYWETRRGPIRALGADMRPGSDLLTELGTTEPPGEVYTAIGGDPWLFRWYRHGAHGFDDQVPTESVFMDGAALDTFASFHGRTLDNGEALDLITETLRAGDPAD